MALPNFTSTVLPVGSVALNGGLNSTSGPLGLQDNEASDLQNIDFNKFGSVIKRNGSAQLNTTVASISTGSITVFADGGDSDTTVTSNGHGLSEDDIIQISGTTSYNGVFTINTVNVNDFIIETAFVADDATGTWNETGQVNGLHWYEYDSSGTDTQKAVSVVKTGIFKMDDLDGTWDDITGGLTVTDGSHWSFVNWLNTTYSVNDTDAPFKWTGSGNATAWAALPTNVTVPKHIEQFNNYLFIGNVQLSGVVHNSRIYWSTLKDADTWSSLDFIDIAKDDGQEITRLKVLSDRLVIYKTRSIYNLFFTGTSGIPFVLPGGGKSNSPVGCIATHSIQELENGHVFLSHDGFYFYDGNNAFKISDKITTTIQGLNTTRLEQAKSLVQKDKNRYMCSLPSSGQTTNDRVLVWDYFNNAWSVYVGLDPSAMAVFYVSGNEERVYFGDYSGFTYRMDTGGNDNPLGTETAVDAFYTTNWRHFGDLIDKKGINHVTVFYQSSNSVLTFSYTYDFESGEQFSQTFSLSAGVDTYGTGVFGIATYAGAGGAVKRRDLDGRGRVVRFKFRNAVIDETFQIDGLGQAPHLETNV